MTRFPIGAAATTRSDAPRPGYRFHDDTVPLRHATKLGERHILLLVDDYSRAMFLRLLKLLSESVEQLKDFVVRLEAHFGRERVVAQLRTDSASYFSKSIVLKNFCNQKGIELTHSPPYTQALNGIAERHVRTVLDVTRALLIEAGAPVSLWGFAIRYAVKINFAIGSTTGPPADQLPSTPRPALVTTRTAPSTSRRPSSCSPGALCRISETSSKYGVVPSTR